MKEYYYAFSILQLDDFAGVKTHIFTAGLALIGFGVLILLFPEFFATIAAVFFFIIGIGACVTAVKIYIAQRAIDKQMRREEDESDDHRRNVRIKID